MVTYDVFLSHARADQPEVEILARRLLEDGVEPFLDRWHIVPGAPWQEELEKALETSRACAVLVGRGLGPWQNREMRAALNRHCRDGNFRVIPVLLPGGPDPAELSSFLQQFTAVDFRGGLDDEGARHRLVCGIHGTPPGAGAGAGVGTVAVAVEPTTPTYRVKLPPRDFFVYRQELDKVRDLLTRAPGSTIGITTALRGAGGFGKTALARALCDEPDVRRQYPDGILWTTLGESLDDADRVDRVLDLVRWWTREEPPAFKSVRDAGDYLKELLDGERVLVVVDDVWRAADLEPFRDLDPATVLVTTRNVRALPEGTRRFDVDAMASDEALVLLAHGLPPVEEGRLGVLAGRLGDWPLLLRLVNGQLKDHVRQRGLDVTEALDRVVSRLDKAGLRAFNQRDARQRDEAVSLTINLSLDELPLADRQRFKDLAVFPEDVNIPIRVVGQFWALEDWEAEEFSLLLEDFSLLLALDLKRATIRLHDVVRRYLIDLREDLPSLHQRLLERCRPANGRWSAAEDPYFLQWLPHHLREGGAIDQLKDLLVDFSWLQTKLEATSLLLLLRDYDLVEQPEYQLIQDALRLSDHILSQDSAQLVSQLHCRLDAAGSPIVGRLLENATASARQAWFRPTTRNMMSPGGPLIRTIIGHEKRVCAMALTPDGMHLVTASMDTTMKLWHLESGREVWRVVAQTKKTRRFDGRSEVDIGWILWIAITPDGQQVITHAVDGLLRYWSFRTGELLRECHRKGDLQNVVTPGGRYVLSAASFGDDPRLWSGLSGEGIRVLSGHAGWVEALALTHDGKRALSAYGDHFVRLWDLDTGELLRRYQAPFERICGVELTPDGKQALMAGEGATNTDDQATTRLGLFDLETGAIGRLFEGGGKNFSQSQDGGYVAATAAVSDNTVGLWELSSGERCATYHLQSPGRIAIDSCNDRLLVATGDGDIKLFHLSPREESRGDAQRSQVNCLNLLPGGEQVLSGHEDGTLRLWSLSTKRELRTYRGHADRVNALAITPDGKSALSASGDCTLKLWDIASGEVVRTFKGHGGSVSAVCILPGGTQALSGGYRQVNRWDLESGEIINHYHGYKCWDTWISVTPNGLHFLVSCAREADQLAVWDLESGKRSGFLQGHKGAINTVIAIDETRAVSAGLDHKLILWDLVREEQLKTYMGHSLGLVAVDFKDGQLISTSFDRTMKLWDLESGRCLASFYGDDLLTTVAMISTRALVAGDKLGGLHFFEIEGLPFDTEEPQPEANGLPSRSGCA